MALAGDAKRQRVSKGRHQDDGKRPEVYNPDKGNTRTKLEDAVVDPPSERKPDKRVREDDEETDSNQHVKFMCLLLVQGQAMLRWSARDNILQRHYSVQQMSNEQYKNWPAYLRLIEHTWNTAVHSTMLVSPFQAARMGCQPKQLSAEWRTKVITALQIRLISQESQPCKRLPKR